jgi:hypothetical protein
MRKFLCFASLFLAATQFSAERANAAVDSYLYFGHPPTDSITVDGSSLPYTFNAADDNGLYLTFTLPSPTATYYLYVENLGAAINFDEVISVSTPSQASQLDTTVFSSKGAPLIFSPDSSGYWKLLFDPPSGEVLFTLEDTGLLTNPPNLSPTPLPAALPLFATALSGLGLLGWRRKRKAQALA